MNGKPTAKNFQDLTQESENPVVIADDQGFVVYINPQFTETYLWSEDLIGKTLADIIPINLGFSRFRMTEISHVANHSINAMVITQDGRSLLSEHYITAQQIEGKWYFAAQLRPLN
jgi:PAS domain S-box-containing protein